MPSFISLIAQDIMLLGIFPAMGLLLLPLLLPNGDFLRAHVMHLVARCTRTGNPAPAEANSKVEKDLKAWGILDSSGGLSPAGVASIIMLIEAESPRDVAETFGLNSAIGSFYREVIEIVLASDAQGPRENLKHFNAILRGLVQELDAHSSEAKTQKTILPAPKSREVFVPGLPPEVRRANALEQLARAVHNLAESSAATHELALSRGDLRIRRKVLLMPKNSPQQARIIWKIEGNLLPLGDTLQDRESYLAYGSRMQHTPEVPWPEKGEKIDAIFAIYLGTRTCRVSLFSADRRAAALSLYADLLRHALRSANPSKPTYTVAAPSADNGNRRTLTASWVKPIDSSVTPAEILRFTNEVWMELSAAMIRIIKPTPEFVDGVRAAPLIDRPSVLPPP